MNYFLWRIFIVAYRLSLCHWFVQLFTKFLLCWFIQKLIGLTFMSRDVLLLSNAQWFSAPICKLEFFLWKENSSHLFWGTIFNQNIKILKRVISFISIFKWHYAVQGYVVREQVTFKLKLHFGLIPFNLICFAWTINNHMVQRYSCYEYILEFTPMLNL
jgi:hypothetical protein